MTPGPAVVIPLEPRRGHARSRVDAESPAVVAQEPSGQRRRVSPIAPLLAGLGGVAVAAWCFLALVGLSPFLAVALLVRGGRDA